VLYEKTRMAVVKGIFKYSQTTGKEEKTGTLKKTRFGGCAR